GASLAIPAPHSAPPLPTPAREAGGDNTPPCGPGRVVALCAGRCAPPCKQTCRHVSSSARFLRERPYSTVTASSCFAVIRWHSLSVHKKNTRSAAIFCAPLPTA